MTKPRKVVVTDGVTGVLLAETSCNYLVEAPDDQWLGQCHLCREKFRGIGSAGAMVELLLAHLDKPHVL